MLQIILAIVAFGLLVIVHEFGHFISAKRGGVQVNEFWIGMGPTLLKKEHNGTLYCLKALPFGGACVMEGEDSESDNDHAFGKASLPRRMLIVAAGALLSDRACGHPAERAKWRLYRLDDRQHRPGEHRCCRRRPAGRG